MNDNAKNLEGKKETGGCHQKAGHLPYNMII